MLRSVLSCVCSLALLGALGACAVFREPAPAPQQIEAERLRFSITDGRIENAFFREGPSAAHLVLTSGEGPRLVAAFPAGNSGVGLWFKPTREPVRWRLEQPLNAARGRTEDGDALHGVETVVSVSAEEPLVVAQALLSNVRVLRDFGYSGTAPAQVTAKPVLQQGAVQWRRDRLDGQGGYMLRLAPEQGRVELREGAVVLIPKDGALRLRLTALTGDAPLTPIPQDELLQAGAAVDPLSRQVLAFLSYDEKLLAGSWQFLTYFGRDTLLSLQLLMPVLAPRVVEAGLSSVIERMNSAGEVAHEEDLAEFALLRRQAEGQGQSADAIFDYKMVDDDFMLAPVAAAYLLETPQGRARGAAFLARRTRSGEHYAEALARNAAFVLGQTRAFAADPRALNLIALKPGVPVGEWRDSNEGLGGGRYAYNVNAALAPAALEAIAALARAGHLPIALEKDALAQAQVWRTRAPPLFEVSLPADQAAAAVAAHAKSLQAPAAAALQSLPAQGPVRFPALSLDAAGRPIPVLHSDYGFTMLFTDPEAAALERMIEAALRPFPAGLLTDAGLLVANAAYADPARLWPLFTPSNYHGAVVWSWQQAMFAAGLARQRARADLPEPLRARIALAQTRLWRVIEATNAGKTAELWSWSVDAQGYRPEPFGQRAGDVTEANAAQLWSTVYLGVQPTP